MVGTRKDFATSFSPGMMLFIDMAKQDPQKKQVGENLLKILEDTVTTIEEDDEVVASLKVKPIKNERQLRNITIRKFKDGPAFIECYVGWNWDLNKWHLLIELPNESHWLGKESVNRPKKFELN